MPDLLTQLDACPCCHGWPHEPDDPDLCAGCADRCGADCCHPQIGAEMPDPATTRRIDCPQQCQIPDGVSLREVPTPRHKWADVLICPNDGCERAFLVTKEDDDA